MGTLSRRWSSTMSRPLLQHYANRLHFPRHVRFMCCSSLLHLALFMVASALLAIPLAQLTFARPERAEPPRKVETAAPETHATIPALVRVRFAHKPQKVSLKLDGHELLAAPSAQHATSSMESRASLSNLSE